MADENKDKSLAKPSLIPQVTIPEAKVYGERMQPKDEEFTDGMFKHSETGEPYALCKHEPDTYGNTHSLKNSAHFWQGREKEFRATFEKK